MHIWFTLQIDCKKISNFLCGSFFIELNFLSKMSSVFEIFESCLEVQRVERKFSDNPGHNILELASVLVQV